MGLAQLIHLFDRFGRQIPEEQEEEPLAMSRRSFFFLSAGLIAAPLVAPRILEATVNIPVYGVAGGLPIGTLAVTNSEIIALQLEKVRHKLPLLYERSDVLYQKLIEKEGTTSVRLPSRSARIPMKWYEK